MRLLKTIEQIAEREESHLAYEHAELCTQKCPVDRPDTWVNRWKARQDFIKAGISDDGVIAIEGFIHTDRDGEIRFQDLGLFSNKFFEGLFHEENLLSGVCFEMENLVCYHFLAFPLSGRQLSTDPWIDSRSFALKDRIYRKYVELAERALDVDLSIKASADNGHTEYLDAFPKVTTSKEDMQEIVYNTISEESQAQTDYPKDRIWEIENETIKYFTTGVEKGNFLKLNSGDISEVQYLDEAKKYLARMYPDMTDRDTGLVIKKLKSAATGFYILDDLINDPKISDIKIVSPSKIRVKVEGARKTSNLKFIDMDDYFRFLDGIMLRYDLDKNRQIHVFTDAETHKNFILRNNITLGDINSGYPTYHIRKIPKTKYSLEDLIRFNVMDEAVANYLIWAAREAKGIVFTGKGSSGKTTLMNTLLEYTPCNASGLIIQESDELFSSKPEMTVEHITEDYDLKDLAKNGLLTDIDYFIIGEVKGEEAMYFINACDTGNKAWCSVHSPSSEEAINKLADYVMYASKYNHEEALYMLKELQVIVFMKNFKVAEISEVVGWDESTHNLKYRTVFRKESLLNQMRPVT